MAHEGLQVPVEGGLRSLELPRQLGKAHGLGRARKELEQPQREVYGLGADARRVVARFCCIGSSNEPWFIYRTAKIRRRITADPDPGEESQMNAVVRLAAGAACFALFGINANAQGGRAPAELALAGQVSSAEEGPMEGVVVSAKKDGSTITVSVVTDAQGRFAFPAARLEPGRYSLKARAAGYELDGARAADVAADGKPRPTSSSRRRATLPRSSPMPNGCRACRARTSRSGSCSTATAATRSSAS